MNLGEKFADTWFNYPKTQDKETMTNLLAEDFKWETVTKARINDKIFGLGRIFEEHWVSRKCKRSIIYRNETQFAKDKDNSETEATNFANSLTEKADLKASAKAKLIAGEALTEDEANTIVL